MKIYNEVKKNILSVKLDKRNEIMNWGLDNAYPSLIETLINISVTSKACVDKTAKAIYGKSFGDLGKIIVNKDGQTLNEVLRIASREYAKHNNCFIHISYNLLYEITAIKVLPATNIRIGKADDLGYRGRFIGYDNWNKDEGKVEPNKFKVYHKFNPNKTVLETQIEAAGGITRYKGQVIHLQKDSNSVYSLSDLNSVLHLAIEENNSNIFLSKGSEKGFVNTKIVVTQPFSNEDDRRRFERDIKSVQGVENSGDLILLESSNITDNLDSQIKIYDATSTVDKKTFEYSDIVAEKKITKAFGVPLLLIDTSNDGLFGNSGESIKEAKKQLWEHKEEERDQIESLFQSLLSNFHIKIEGDVKIISPFEEEITEVATPIEDE